MSKYKGLFTFDVDNHRYTPVEQADGLIDCIDYRPEPEEPKTFYYITGNGYVVKDNDTITQDYADRLESIGNYFATREEAEKTVEKLKAWRWLKDNGVSLKYDKDKFILHIVVSGKISPNQWRTEGYMQKLDLLFGGVGL